MLFSLFISHLLKLLEVKVKVAQLCPTLRAHGLYSPWNSPGQNTGVGSLCLLQGSSQLRDQTQVSHIAGSSPAEPLGKPKNTGMSSLSLLQGIFPTQELNNRGLLHCRRILYQLSYQDFLTTRPFFLVRSPKPQ